MVSTVLFDSYSEVIHDRLKLENVSALTEKEYNSSTKQSLPFAVLLL